VEVAWSPGSSIQDVIVSLRGSTGQGWPVSINPDVVQVNPGSEAYFTATVTLPTECSTYVQDALEISGVSRNYPGVAAYNVPPITGSIQVAQYCQFELHSPEPNICTKSDSKVIYNVNINNHGNGRDTFIVKINNLAELDNKDIDVTLSIKTAEVDEKSNYSFEVKVDVPSGGKASGKNTIEVIVASELGNEEADMPNYRMICLELDVEGGTILGMSYLSFGVIVMMIIIIVAAVVVVKRKKGTKERTFLYNRRKDTLAGA
jgi:hypothetical protein